jgi:hypothetical protein
MMPRLVAGIGVVTLMALSLSRAAPVVETLPGPVLHGSSFELLANSRYSVHSGFTEDLPRQVLANVLWAMSKVPCAGAYREFYVATPENVLVWDPARNELKLHKAGDQRYSSGSAFEVGVATPRYEDAGMAIQAGLLAGTAFWTRAGGEVASCPMKWATDNANAEWNPRRPIRMVNVYGRAETEGLDTLLAARSSDTSLSPPHVAADDSFEVVLMGLRQDTAFGPDELSPENISQLCWAANGATPHLTLTGSAGLTIPSVVPGGYLTGRVYVVRATGVQGFSSFAPAGADAGANDHRLAPVARGDRSAMLVQACARIPSRAAAHFVIAVDDTVGYGPMLEAGFAAFQLLAQARSLGLSACLTYPLSQSERPAIAVALGLPAKQHPALVFSCGEPAAASDEPDRDDGLVRIVRGQPAVKHGILRLEYSLKRSGPVRAEVFDLLGRPVRLLVDEQQSVGYHSVTWDGTDEGGRAVKRGSYVVVVTSGGTAAQHKVTWAK